jgi:hypothetical protein
MPEGGFVHMLTEVVEPMAHRLTAMGDELMGAWRSGQARLDAANGAIGTDPLGQAFARGYTARSEELRARAERLPTAMRDDGEVGAGSVVEYSAADTRAADAVRAVTPGRE